MTLWKAAKNVILAYGGDWPDFLKDELAALENALEADATCHSPGADATCPSSVSMEGEPTGDPHPVDVAPVSQKVWVLAYVHGNGDDVTVYRSKESALAAAKEIIDRYIDDEEEAEERYQDLIELGGIEVEPQEWLSVQDAVVLP